MKKYIVIIITVILIVNILYAQENSTNSTNQDTAKMVRDYGSKTNEPWYKIEAYSNYVVFVAGIVLGLLAWILKNFLWGKKPAVIRVVKKEEESLIDLAPEARNRLTINYNNQTITEFHRTSFAIYNLGTQTINDIIVKLLFDGLEQNDFFEFSPIDWDDNLELTISTETEKSIQLKIPFLNSMRIHKDKLAFDIYTPKKIKIEVRGRGPGWSIKYFDKVAFTEKLSTSIEIGSFSGSLVTNLLISTIHSALSKKSKIK